MAPPREKNATVLRARALRRELTLSEGMLWQVLRQRPGDLKFRLQHPIGRCIVDFYCAAAKAHGMGDRPLRDIRRDAWLKSRGLRVIRFAATDVTNDLSSVVTAITFACRR